MERKLMLKDGTDLIINKAHKGDCLPFLKNLPDKCVDILCTDPPYGIGISHNIGRREGDESSAYKKVDWDDEVPSKEVFDEMFRVTKHQIIWGANYFSPFLPGSPGWVYWNKMFSNDVSFASGELAFTSYDKPMKTYQLSPSAMQDRIHPTQKPLKLIKWCLNKYAEAEEGMLVLDPFLGSFTTAVACYDLKLNWIGCERDEDNYEAGMLRYIDICKQPSLF